MKPLILTLQFAALTVSSAAFAQLPLPFSQTAAQAYVSAPGTELRLELEVAGQGMVSGVSISQKYLTHRSAQFCRKVEVLAPDAQPTYACFSQSMDENTAAAVYARMQALETTVLFRDADSGSPLLGVSWIEKSQGDELCVATSPIVPHAPVSYNCFLRTNEVHGPMGGGVTVGN